MMAGYSSVTDGSSVTAHGAVQCGKSSVVVYAKRRKAMGLCLGAGPTEERAEARVESKEVEATFASR
jgi:hypothetical protein